MTKEKQLRELLDIKDKTIMALKEQISILEKNRFSVPFYNYPTYIAPCWTAGRTCIYPTYWYGINQPSCMVCGHINAATYRITYTTGNTSSILSTTTNAASSLTLVTK